jgi:hypothetical protein
MLPVTGPIPVCNPPGSIALAPDFTHAYPWSENGAPIVKIPSILVNMYPTSLNPVGMNATLVGNVVIRYHIVLDVPTSVGNPETSQEVQTSFRLQPISICSLPTDIFCARIGDRFGHGVLRRSNRPGEVAEVELKVYRAHPYPENDDGQGILAGKLKQRIPPAETFALKGPGGILRPLAGCTLSGRYVYGERHSGVTVLRSCIDYLP